MELDGRLVIESDDIMRALEKEFPDHRPLMPPPTSPDDRKRAELLLRLERRLFGDWLRWLTNGWCACPFSPLHVWSMKRSAPFAIRGQQALGDSSARRTVLIDAPDVFQKACIHSLDECKAASCPFKDW